MGCYTVWKWKLTSHEEVIFIHEVGGQAGKVEEAGTLTGNRCHVIGLSVAINNDFVYFQTVLTLDFVKYHKLFGMA